MTKVIETVVCTFDELSDKAKEKARDWFIEASCHDEWWEFVYEDAGRIGLKITHFDLGRGREIGLQFAESHEEVCRRIMVEHGDSCDTHEAAVAYLAEVTRTRMARGNWAVDMLTDEQSEFRNALKEAYLKMLDEEWEWRRSDEYVDDGIVMNEYTFTESGERFG